LNPAKKASFLWESPSKEHWKSCYDTLLDDFLEIDRRLGDISFVFGLLLLNTWYKCHSMVHLILLSFLSLLVISVYSIDG
jgi:hypothetical protein